MMKGAVVGAVGGGRSGRKRRRRGGRSVRWAYEYILILFFVFIICL